MKQFIRTWKESRRFLRNDESRDGIVIYSEGDSYAPYILPFINELAEVFNGKVFYLTSDPSDRILLDTPCHVISFFIGTGSMRTHVFSHMKAKVVAMTMPDLNTFHIKRSRHVHHYTYLQHSLVSTHMVYRKGAFDHFDSIFCTGPYQTHEIREWEELQRLPAKEIFEHGYPPLDALIKVGSAIPAPQITKDKRLNILLAPSWGPEGLMETRAEELVHILLDVGHLVRVRPHPRTRQLSGQVLDRLASKFIGHSGFDMNEDVTNFDALLQSHVMISDWSGVAMDFALGLGRPVLFIDVPRKINNPEYSRLKAVPLEVLYREEIGAVLSPDRLDDLPAALAYLLERAPLIKARSAELRKDFVYNLGTSARRGARILAEISTRDD